ncbi:MAG: PepSY-associated TM helix domain-containing protein, partial [Sphingomonas sp.]
MGVTGALIAFEDEIMAALSPGVVTVAPGRGERLSPDALIKTARAQNGGVRVARLMVHRDPALAPLVMFEPPPGQRQRGRSYIDPVTGRLLGPATGTDFFRFVNDLHRWLAVPNGRDNLARQATGIASIALVFFALSGLWLRWPRRALDWRSWFRLDLRKRGRHLHRELHVTIGTWLVPIYLLSALTGLWWSY